MIAKKFGFNKPETSLYRPVWNVFRYPEPFNHNHSIFIVYFAFGKVLVKNSTTTILLLQKDGRADRRTDIIADSKCRASLRSSSSSSSSRRRSSSNTLVNLLIRTWRSAVHKNSEQ